MGRLPDEASFLKDVANHEMNIIRDDGLYRHVRFRRPTTICMWFDIVTWPGHLAYSGDMGCYTFSRIEDMFEFFRRDSTYQKDPDRIYVNPGYWGEKVQSVDRNGPLSEYSPELFKAGVERWMDDGEWPRKTRLVVADQVLSRADDGEHEAMRAAMEFEHEGHQFDCFYEVGVREISYRFLWCCYAPAWAVKQYDGRRVDGAGVSAEMERAVAS